MKNKLKQLIAATALGCVCLAAHAAPSQLYFTQAAGWLNPQDADPGTFTNFGSSGLVFDGMHGTPAAGAPAGTSVGMSWHGTLGSSIKSSIELYSYSSPHNVEFIGNGDTSWNQNEWWAISQIHHQNNILGANSAPNPLWIADAVANLHIYDDAGFSNVLVADTDSATRIEFWETWNGFNVVPGGQGCPSGSQNPLGTFCDDIYTIVANELDPLTFWIGGDQYQIAFTLVPGGNDVLICSSSLDPGCAGVTVPPGEIMVFTAEDNPGTSDIYVAMSWSLVPEPGSLALAGLGLMGLAAARRRKTA